MKPIRWMMFAALAACGGAGAAAGDAQPVDTGVAAAPRTSSSEAADSVVSGDAPPPLPVDVAAQDTLVTPWVALELPSEPWSQTAESPEALLRRVRDVVAAQLEEPDAGVLPTRMESQAADSATGILVEPVTGDDSIQHTEFRLRMRRAGSAWTVAGVERRSRCRRGVTAEGLCL